MAASGIFLAVGGVGMAVAALAVRGGGKPAADAHPYRRTAYAIAPVQLLLALTAISFGVYHLVGR